MQCIWPTHMVKLSEINWLGLIKTRKLFLKDCIKNNSLKIFFFINDKCNNLNSFYLSCLQKLKALFYFCFKKYQTACCMDIQHIHIIISLYFWIKIFANIRVKLVFTFCYISYSKENIFLLNELNRSNVS